jgi:hypothetical protein
MSVLFYFLAQVTIFQVVWLCFNGATVKVCFITPFYGRQHLARRILFIVSVLDRTFSAINEVSQKVAPLQR